jgi:hypothetical protein
MADQFQIPQPNPQYVPPVPPPYDLVNADLNRTQQAVQAGPNALKSAAEMLIQNYYKNQQAKAGAFEAGGPYLMNMLYGNGQQQPPQYPAQQPQGQAPAQVGTPLPSNGAATPASSAQTLQPSVSGDVQPPIDPHAPGGTIHTSVNQIGNPDWGGIHAQKILELQKQMAGNAQMGKYGQTLNTGLKDQLSAEQALMGQEQFQQGQTRQQNQFNQSQDAEESRFQRGQKTKVAESVAGEVSKERQKKTSTDTAQEMLNTFAKTFISTDKNGNLVDLTHPSSVPFVTGAKARLSQSTSGRIGGEAGGEMLNKAQTLSDTVVGILTAGGRMTPDAARGIAQAMVPKPDEPTPMKIKHLDEVQHLIDTVKSGDQEALNTVISTLTGSPGSAIQR